MSQADELLDLKIPGIEAARKAQTRNDAAFLFLRYLLDKCVGTHGGY